MRITTAHRSWVRKKKTNFFEQNQIKLLTLGLVHLHRAQTGFLYRGTHLSITTTTIASGCLISFRVGRVRLLTLRMNWLKN